jgi:hypothetical protein
MMDYGYSAFLFSASIFNHCRIIKKFSILTRGLLKIFVRQTANRWKQNLQLNRCNSTIFAFSGLAIPILPVQSRVEIYRPEWRIEL